MVYNISANLWCNGRNKTVPDKVPLYSIIHVNRNKIHQNFISFSIFFYEIWYIIANNLLRKENVQQSRMGQNCLCYNVTTKHSVYFFMKMTRLFCHTEIVFFTQFSGLKFTHFKTLTNSASNYLTNFDSFLYILWY